MCYEVSISNNLENIAELIKLGFNYLEHIPESAPYIGVQLNTHAAVGRSYVSSDNPLIRIKYLPALLVLPTTKARIEYLWEEFLITEHVYKHLLYMDELVSRVKKRQDI